MIQSMTGFGKATAAFKTKKINVEIKSLNSKNLDLSTRIAPLYREKEMEIRQYISKNLERGKVDFAIWIDKDATTDATPINAALVQNYYQQIKKISAETGIPEPTDWYSTLLRLPDVTTKTDVEELSDEEWEVAKNAICEAVNHLVAFRKQEGAALQKKFTEKVDNIQALLASIEPYEKARVEKIRQNIVNGLQQIPNVDYDKNRLEQELIYYIEKLDISEEKQRLSNHLKYFRETMNEEGHGVGKKLGFIAQEMGREIESIQKSSPDLLNENIRLELARMAVREHPCLKVSDFEFRLPPRPTRQTLCRLTASLSRPALHISHRCRQLACFQGLEETGRDSKPPSHLGLPPSRLRGGGRVPSPRCQAYGHPAHRHQLHRTPPSHLPRRRRLYGLDEAVWQEIRKKDTIGKHKASE